MLGNFKYSNPTILYFGKESILSLNEELPKYGKNVLLIYGGSSIKKNGIYDEVIQLLHSNDKNVYEDAGVMPNPSLDKLYEGIKIARKNNVDFILAVGGGSVVDYAKAVSVSIHCEEDPWDKYFDRFEDVSCEIVPMGCILTMVGTGSEMNGGSVITNAKTKEKIGHVFNENVFPKFAILNPVYTFTVPHYQMIAGFFDIMSHILEQYFSGNDDNTSDYLAEGLMKSLIHSSKIAVKEPTNYEARSNIMWTSTWALNTLIHQGKPGDWMVHMMGQAIGAYTDATHGMTLAAVSIPYYRHILSDGLDKFKRFAINVWNVNPDNKTDIEIANEGLFYLENFMKELGLVMSIKELGVTESMINDIASKSFFLEGGFKKLSYDEIVGILKASM